MSEWFDEQFCDDLNLYLMRAMAHCDHPLAMSCYMDGVLMPFADRHLSKKYVNEVREIETHAWALSDKGDIKFELTIRFGKYALRRYAKGSPLTDCFPPANEDSFMKIDFDNEKIELQLL
jgi:hypothetical protein